MKKTLSILLATLVGLITCIQPIAIVADSEEQPEMESLEERYYELLNEKIQNHSIQQVELNNEFEFYTSSFSIFNSIESIPTTNVLEEQENSYSNKEAIISDSSNNLLIYASVIDDNHMKLIIEGNIFEIVADKNDVYCVSSSGETLKIMENISEDETQTIDQYAEENSSARSGSWVLVTRHLKGTNTMLLQAVSEISTIGGTVAWVCGNSLFGSIFTITGLFSYIGQKMTVTLYTDYDRYYKSDCTTYIRDYIRFYQYNNYTGYVGAGNSYFHSVRPDYSGQNCMAYA